MNLKKNAANFLTVLRVFLIPLVINFLYLQSSFYLMVSLGLFLFAILTDVLDGYIARTFKTTSSFGTLMDPIADKMLFLSLIFVWADLKVIPLWTSLLYLFREFLNTGIRQLGANRGIIVGANWMGKLKVTLQVMLFVFIYFSLNFKTEDFFIKHGAMIISVSNVTILILSYVFTGVFIYRNRALFKL